MTECACPHRLIDHVHQTVGHPYVACPFYGQITRTVDPGTPVRETAPATPGEDGGTTT